MTLTTQRHMSFLIDVVQLHSFVLISVIQRRVFVLLNGHIRRWPPMIINVMMST